MKWPMRSIYREKRQIRDNLRQWTALGVKEARNQRKRVR